MVGRSGEIRCSQRMPRVLETNSATSVLVNAAYLAILAATLIEGERMIVATTETVNMRASFSGSVGAGLRPVP
jgi:hypothetical protein